MSHLRAPAQALLISLLALRPSHYQRDSLQAWTVSRGERSALSRTQSAQIVISPESFSQSLLLANSTSHWVGTPESGEPSIDPASKRQTSSPASDCGFDLPTQARQVQAVGEPNSSLQSQARVASGGALPCGGLLAIALELAHLSGKAELTQVQLALEMIRALSRRLRQHYQLIILADSAFGSSEFLHQILPSGERSLMDVALPNFAILDSSII